MVVPAQHTHLDQRAVRPSWPQPLPGWCAAIRPSSGSRTAPVTSQLRPAPCAPTAPCGAWASYRQGSAHPSDPWRPLGNPIDLGGPCPRWAPTGLGEVVPFDGRPSRRPGARPAPAFPKASRDSLRVRRGPWVAPGARNRLWTRLERLIITRPSAVLREAPRMRRAACLERPGWSFRC